MAVTSNLIGPLSVSSNHFFLLWLLNTKTALSILLLCNSRFFIICCHRSCISTHTHRYIHTYIHTHILYIYIRTHIHKKIKTSVYIYIYMYVCIYTYIYACSMCALLPHAGSKIVQDLVPILVTVGTSQPRLRHEGVEHV